MEKYSKKVAQLVMDYLKEEDLNYSFDEDKGAITLKVRHRSAIRQLNYHILIRDKFCMTYAYPAFLSAGDKMPEFKEMVCRMNYGLRCGNFELDTDDGEIRYKVFIDCSEEDLPAKRLLASLVYIPYKMFTVYGNAMMRVLLGDATPNEAVIAAEGKAEIPLRSTEQVILEPGVEIKTSLFDTEGGVEE